ncbi:hypothetical protein D024_0471 [Vibrio parahaemolyticus 3259]|nr:hypothetical protein D035_0498 [Vibrio parahaemolyticus VP250]EQM05873.1 hypothetical protein D036_0141 [Vibrio parahaemolyticus VP232]EQM09426.1 hypothetical protein D045_2737 [Vibrio parahaemolyticus VP-NY4]EQM12569.1 hypothetical protein D024_0471 [Vibrio parahaemolyticus 3259]
MYRRFINCIATQPMLLPKIRKTTYGSTLTMIARAPNASQTDQYLGLSN